MQQGYEINELAKEESWRMFRIIGELVEGFDTLSGIEPAVTIYGSSRIKDDDPLYVQTEEIAYRLGEKGFSIITGGGPGVMEAANKGALRANVTSVGLNIEISDEEGPNKYTTKLITFHHFFTRKVMLIKYAAAFVIMPGGLGTLDELSEVLTLIKTRKIRPFPVVLFNSEYWKGFLNWLQNIVLDRRFIFKEELNLLRLCDNSDEVVDIICRWNTKKEVTGGKAVVH